MRNLILLIVAGAGLLLARPAFANDESRPYVETTGKSTIYVTPDQAVITFGVRVPRSELRQAIDDAETLVDRILPAVRELGIDEGDLATSSFRIQRKTERLRQADGSDKTNAYFEVVRTFTVTTTPDQVAAVIEAAFNNGATTLGGVRFGVEEPRELADEARMQALTAAREKAVAMAAALGAKAGKPLRIEETQSLPWRNSMSNTISFEARDGGGGAVQVPTGEVAVSAEVRVRFVLNSD